jgi:hypothetical protein
MNFSETYDALFTDLAITNPHKGNIPQIPLRSQQTVTFEIPIVGGGAAGTAPPWGRFMTACEMLETVSAGVSVKYLPTDGTTAKTLTIWYWWDGILHKMYGAKGTWGYKLASEAIPVLTFSMTGIADTITDAASPGGTWSKPNVLPVRKVNTTGTVFAYGACIKSVDYSHANQIVTRDLINCSGTIIPDRKPTGKLVFEMPTVAQLDVWGDAKNITLGAISLTHGTVAGNIVNFQHQSVQLKAPTYTRENNILMGNCDFSPFIVSGEDETQVLVT